MIAGTGKKIKPVEGTTDEKKWLQVDQEVCAGIILAINPREQSHIKHCVTSNAVWNKFKDDYESKRPEKKATLLKQLLFK